jgi:hypothetical protein
MADTLGLERKPPNARALPHGRHGRGDGDLVSWTPQAAAAAPGFLRSSQS